MGQSVLIVADSGSGKSTSIETLDPRETFIINVANKPLPFKGWKKMYAPWTKESPRGNLYHSSNYAQIEACFHYVNAKRLEIKTLIIDDFQYMSAFEYFDRADEKGYEKFTQMASHLSRIIRLPKDLRDDLTVIFMMHAEETVDMEGRRKIKAKTIGKMIDNSLTLEGLFSIVLFGKVKKNKEAEIRYVFETVNNGENTCKSPRGMFSSDEIPNDLALVIKSIYEYEN